MRALITGGLGHIGSKLIRSDIFRESFSEVLVVDSLASQRYCSLFDLDAGRSISFNPSDVRTLDLDAVEAVDAIIHLAAQTDAASSVDRRESLFQNNLAGTQHVARLAMQAATRLVFASTTSVYGSQERMVDELCETLAPQSPYAECKLHEEALIREGFEEGLDAIILRFGTIAGPSPGMRFHTAVNKFCLQAARGEPLSVWSTAWRQLRPYLDVEDAVRALVWACTVDVPLNLAKDPTFNVLTENLTVEQVVSHIEGAFGPVRVEFTDHTIMNQLSYEVSADRIAELGFRPTGSIAKAIGRTAQLLSGISG